VPADPLPPEPERFFFLSSYAAIFKPTILFEPVFQPATSSHRYGTEDTPLFVLGIQQNDIRFFLNKIQLLPFKIKFATPFNPGTGILLLPTFLYFACVKGKDLYATQREERL